MHEVDSIVRAKFHRFLVTRRPGLGGAPNAAIHFRFYAALGSRPCVTIWFEGRSGVALGSQATRKNQGQGCRTAVALPVDDAEGDRR